MKTSWLVLAAILFTFSLSAAARADEASHLQAARDLLLASHVDQSYDKMIDQMLDAQAKTSPQLAQLREPMKEFLVKYMGWDAIKDDLAKIYAANFTEQELNEISAFYRTPTGTKMALALPDLTAQGAQLGQQRVAAHMDELKEMVRKSMAEKNGAALSPTPAPAPANH